MFGYIYYYNLKQKNNMGKYQEQNNKLVWLKKDLHRLMSIEAAKNGTRIGGMINKLILEYLDKEGIEYEK
jgi:hypothetical protein